MRNLSNKNEFCVQVHFHANQSHFHIKGFPRRLVLKQRHKVTRKRPIDPFARSSHVVQNNYPETQLHSGTFKTKELVSFVLKVLLCFLRPSIINSVPCDRIVQRTYRLGFV